MSVCLFIYIFLNALLSRNEWQEVFFSELLHILQSCHKNVFPPTSGFLLLPFNQNKVKRDGGEKGGNDKLLSKVISVGIFNNALAWQQKQLLRMISAELLF